MTEPIRPAGPPTALPSVRADLTAGRRPGEHVVFTVAQLNRLRTALSALPYSSDLDATHETGTPEGLVSWVVAYRGNLEQVVKHVNDVEARWRAYRDLVDDARRVYHALQGQPGDPL